MLGTDEFGNTRLLPIAFALVFLALGLATIATSQALWSPGVEAPLTGLAGS